ncbi:MAG: 4-hydroxythreonine-4-phosphate dehydrogenase PdxA [Phycisphaerales bacterium]|nr:MAG: 4-hydroxythreonine-4-phosphate dehydrogenase PdxA [Phycisphaerales bacterium]
MMAEAFDNTTIPPEKPAKPLIGITMGDPAGIGPEVVVKALADPDIRALGRFIIYGLDDVLDRAAGRAGIPPFWFRIPLAEVARIDSGVVVADFEEFGIYPWSIGQASKEGGRASLRLVDEAIEAARSSLIDAIVTGPINKVSWQLAGCKFPGHTEKLADAFRTTRYNMAFVGGGVRVVLASTHLGLLELRNHFNLGLVFQPIELLDRALKDWFGIEYPRIAVAGLNPHAGEDSQFGDEEKRVIEPAMQMARNHGIDVDGPFPPDTLFIPRRRCRYDGFVAMYHDQGLIPVKMLAFDTAVNITLGLPIVRTSVDHGTAFDIADTNAADPGSMKEAIRLACQVAKHAKPTPAPPPSAAIPEV